MKIIGARNGPVAAIRRAPPGGPLAAGGDVPCVPEPELTPAVRGALRTLRSEIGELRGEVARLKARLAEAEGLADRDTLTPLLNRRAFMRELGRVRAFAERYDAPASLVYFDLDGFKAINDRHGHAAGDAALRLIAERLAAQVRESDILGRLGGDEFALILVQTDRATAQAKAAALADAVASEPVAVGGWNAPMQLSYGVCEVGEAADPEAVLALADTEMFAAKRLRKAG